MNTDIFHIYYINILMTTLLAIFRRFPTTFRRFPKIYPNLFEGQTNVSEHSPNIFRRLPKITEDFRGLPKIAEEEPIMFRSYSKTSGYFLRDYVDKAVMIMISSRVKISCYLHVWRYEVFAGKLTWYFTGVYIINGQISYLKLRYAWRHHAGRKPTETSVTEFATQFVGNSTKITILLFLILFR